MSTEYSNIPSLISRGFNLINDLKEKNDEHLTTLKDQYWEVCKLPRKLKKKRRKEIIERYETFLWAKNMLSKYIPDFK